MTATGNPGDDHQDVGPDAGQPEDAPPPPQWLNDGEQPSGAEPLLPEPAPLPPFGTPLPEEPEEDTNRTVSDLDLSGMRTQIFKKEEPAPDTEPPPLPPFPGATDAGEDTENSDYTVADPARWKDADAEPDADSGAVDGDATMIVDADKTMQVNGQPPAPPTPSEQPVPPSDATRVEQAIEPETQQIAGAQQPPAPPAPEPFPWAQEIPGTPPAAAQPNRTPAPPPAQPPAPEPFPWAQEIPGAGTRPPGPAQPPAPEPFPWAQEIPGTPTAPAQPNQPANPQPFPWAQEIPGTGSQPPGPAQTPAPPPQIDEPWRTTPQQNASQGKKKKGKKALLMSVAGLAAVALVAGGGYAVVTMLGGEEKEGGGGAKLAASTFPVSGSAGTDGRDQRLNGVAAAGSTVVAVGAENGANNSRSVFLVSSDGGRTFTSAQVQGVGGGSPRGTEVPQAVSGSAKGWIAIGSGKSGGVVWTSADGKAWKREPDAVGKAFGPGSRVQEIVATTSGYLAIGAATVRGKAQPAVWLSADGRQWEARVGEQIDLKIEKASYSLVKAAASGEALLLMALVKPEKKPPQRRVYASQDGGRTWAASEVPVPKGSRGLTIGGGEAGLLAMREMGKKDDGHGIAFVSKDGVKWSEAGKLETDGYQNTSEILADANGYTALVARAGDVLLSHSTDGKTWKAAGTAPKKPGRGIVDSAAAGGQAVLVGHEPGGGDMDPLLSVWGADGQQVPIDPSKIDGLIRPDHAVKAVGASETTAVAVGSASGDAAVWTSSDGAAWKPAQGLGSAFTRPGPQRLLDVAGGTSGWLAVGYDQASPMRPLVVTSADGASWQAADSAAAFRPSAKGRLVTNAVAAGSAGHVVVGTEDFSAAVWHSADLKSWERATGADPSVLQGREGANRWMLDVAAPDSGFVAVGGHHDAQGNHPAVWSSADGKQWTLKSLPVPSGVSEAHLTHVAAKGDTLVAAGVAGTQQGSVWIGYTSTDGGKTWKDLAAPGGDQKITVTALTATPDGFAGSATSAAAGSTDVVSLTSKDGSSFESTKPGGTGLGGDGDQEITGLAPFKEKVFGVGQSVDASGGQPVLWER
ncbi:hypothetical protein ACFHW2_06860 [Actinomadura sp. LOL_016]|uniref:hypothetical protein n=1 Tax=unclassified Actinomadura TaxID=2626254 RepID=UPI003A7F675F